MKHDFPWPEPDMILFEAASGNDWRANARLPDTPDWILYKMAYEEAARVLIERASSGKDQDFLIYPIIFSARHAIELGFKDIIRLGNELLEKDKTSPIGHDLLELWQEIRDQLAAIETEDSDDDIRSFEALLAQLHTIDPRSITFRYPSDTQNRPTFCIENGGIPNLINTKALGHGIEAMLSFLTGFRDWLNDLVEAHVDFNRDYEEYA